MPQGGLPRETARMKRSRLDSDVMASIFTPDTSTLANRKVVMPPSTQSGMVVKKAPTLASRPARNQAWLLLAAPVTAHQRTWLRWCATAARLFWLHPPFLQPKRVERAVGPCFNAAAAPHRHCPTPRTPPFLNRCTIVPAAAYCAGAGILRRMKPSCFGG